MSAIDRAHPDSPRHPLQAAATHGDPMGGGNVSGPAVGPAIRRAQAETAGAPQDRALLQGTLTGGIDAGELATSLPPLTARRHVAAPPAEAAPERPLPELVDGRYEVLDLLAESGRSLLLRVRHAHLGKELALKLQTARATQSAEERARLAQVTRVLTRMSHPNLVRITDAGVDAEQGAFLVMELTPGEPLRAELRARRTLPLHSAVYITLRLADALSYVHSLGLVHGDVCVDNVLLCPVGPHTDRHEVTLLDFGSARERSAEGPQTPAEDVLDLGTLLYELVTGRRPFPGSAASTPEAAREEPLRPSLFLEQPLPPSMEDLLLRAVSPDRDVRPQTMAQLILELRTVAETLELPISRGGRMAPLPEEPPETGASLTTRHAVYPIFRLDRFCEVSEANAAFLEFIDTTEEAVTGTALRDTRLYDHFPEAVSELTRQIQLHPGAPFQRLLLFEAGAERTIPLLLSVAPERAAHTRGEVCYTALIIPLLPTL